MAGWRYGLGRVLAFAAPLGDPWTGELLRWASFPGLWAQMVRWTARPLENRLLDARITFVGGIGRLVAEAFTEEGERANFLGLRARVVEIFHHR